MNNKPVVFPNLPVQCSTVMMGAAYTDLFNKPLKDYGVETISVPINRNLTTALQSHCDLSCLHTGENTILCDSAVFHSLKHNSELERIALIPVTEHSSEQYPHDCLLNACIVSDKVFINPKTVSTNVLLSLTQKGLTQINVKQGYTKCSICIVTDNSIITEDSGIYAAALSNGIDVLKIQPGSVLLPGFSYGFIGGATFKISRDKLCFTGNFDRFSKSERDRIYEFLEKHEIEPVILRDEPVLDVGGAIPIFESKPPAEPEA